MKSVEIFRKIELIASNGSKNTKIDLLRDFLDTPEFAYVCKVAYNPLDNFGVSSVSIATRSNEDEDGEEFDDKTFALLDNLINRNLTGSAAISAIEQEVNRLDAESATLLRRILLKDLRAGFSESSLNKASPGLIPSFPYMRCSLPEKSNMEKWDWSAGVFSQEKADGMFANVSVFDATSVTVVSRQGSQFPNYALDRLVIDMGVTFVSGYQYHGELVVEDALGKILPREIGNGILNSLLSGGALEDGNRVVFFAWDMIPLAEVVAKGKYHQPYSARFFDLVALSQFEPDGYTRPIASRVVHSKEEAMRHYRELLAEGKEGVILKNRDAIWQDSTSKDQVKLKVQVDVDLQIIGIEESALDTKNEGRPGALVCISSCEQLRVDVTVKNEAVRLSIEENPRNWIGKIVAVRANAVMNPSASSSNHSLFLPRMAEAGFRTDKSLADSLEEIKDQFAAAIA